MPERLSLLQLKEQFKTVTSHQERYRLLILLSKQLPPMDSSLKAKSVPLSGCESEVWLQLQWDSEGGLLMQGESHARIIKGILALLYILFHQQQSDYILTFELDKLFEELKINGSLTKSKENGIKGIINHILTFCQNIPSNI